ncbi:MAG: molybdopterin-dependent oxidoreductase [Alphaproteobacteria bacterium]|nr:molybdopterin-dependent oxidoreductase [Alphaproteobacteria bacterium]
MNAIALTRRRALQISLTTAGGLLAGVPLPRAVAKAAGVQLGLYVRIEPDERVIIGAPSTEMGQGINTAMPMVIAEELDADWSKVSIEQLPLMIKRNPAGPGWVFTDFPAGAGGSGSMIDAWAFLRPAGAKLRQMLIAAAAQRWKVAASECTTEPGCVVHGATKRRLSYGALASDAAKQAEPDSKSVPLKARKDYRIVGRPQRNAQAQTIVRGTERFGIDVEMPGMLYATIARPPAFDAQIVSIDDKAARAVPGVRDVVRIDGPKPDEPLYILGSGVAVVATSYWAALKGRAALKIAWSASPWASESSETMATQMERLMRGRGHLVNDEGDFDGAIKKAARVIERVYSVPYIAHATMEPQTATAHVRADGCDIIASTQSPGLSSRYAAEITGLERDNIRVLPARLGGGFGRRLEADYVWEAVFISKAVNAPVKVVWTREDDLRHDYYRPAGRHHLVMGVDGAGKVIAYKHRLASTSKSYRRRGNDGSKPWEPDLYDNAFPSGFVPNFQREYFAVESGAPRRSWRAPGHTANAFAVQSFIDEAAHELKQDPLAFRLALLHDDTRKLNYGFDVPFVGARLAGVLRRAAKEAGWGSPLPKGRGRGIAAHFTFSSYCAEVVEVSVDANDKLTVDKVTCAIDCGLPINPLGVKAQCEGGICDALSTALHQQITVKDGAVVEGNFDTYRMMRMDESPRVIDVHIMENDYPPSGMGEPPVPPLAPALCNAIFAATGKRFRDLPIGAQLTKA